jgi:hypothetical protein
MFEGTMDDITATHDTEAITPRLFIAPAMTHKKNSEYD